MNINKHHVIRRPFLLPITTSSRITFPNIKRLEYPVSFLESTPLFTPISYYNIRLDRTPPQNELYNLCILSDDNTAFLKMFETYSNTYTFIGPTINTITAILLAPIEGEWNISHVDIESRDIDENNTSTTILRKYVMYYGDIDTRCFFIPEREPNENIKKEALDLYSNQKKIINHFTIGFLVGGTVLFRVSMGTHSALVFLFSCIVGMIYQLLLQYEIDRVGKQQMFINSTTRLGAISSCIYIAINNSGQLVPMDMWIGLCGFMMQKIALMIVFIL